MRYYDAFKSPQGEILLVATENGLSGIYFKGQKYFPKKDKAWQHAPNHAPLKRAKRELAQYFSGKRKRFSVALDPEGTPFQRSVWLAISTVGFGETITYGELARRARHAGSARAAGAATGRNPLGIIVPCHRIVGANGALTGYAGGLGRKRALLGLEGAGRGPRRTKKGGPQAARSSLRPAPTLLPPDPPRRTARPAPTSRPKHRCRR